MIWNGGAGNWDQAARWSNGIIPNGAGFDVFIDFAQGTISSVTIPGQQSPGSGYEVHSLTVDAGDQLTLGNNRTISAESISLAGKMFLGTPPQHQSEWHAEHRFHRHAHDVFGGGGSGQPGGIGVYDVSGSAQVINAGIIQGNGGFGSVSPPAGAPIEVTNSGTIKGLRFNSNDVTNTGLLEGVGILSSGSGGTLHNAGGVAQLREAENLLIDGVTWWWVGTPETFRNSGIKNASVVVKEFLSIDVVNSLYQVTDTRVEQTLLLTNATGPAHASFILQNLDNVGTLSIGGAGQTINVTIAHTPQAIGTSILGGHWTVGNGNTLTFAEVSTITHNAGWLDFFGPNSVITGLSALQSNSGTLQTDQEWTTAGNFQNSGFINVISPFTVTGDFSNTGNLYFQSTLTVQGTFSQFQNGTLAGGKYEIVAGGLMLGDLTPFTTNAAELWIYDGAGADFLGGVGQLAANNGDLHFVSYSSEPVSQVFTAALVQNSGSITVENNYTLHLSGTLSNSGTVNLFAGGAVEGGRIELVGPGNVYLDQANYDGYRTTLRNVELSRASGATGALSLTSTTIILHRRFFTTSPS